MTTEPHKVACTARFLATAVLSLLILGWLASASPSAPEVPAPRFELLQPGTVVGKDPPRGWSHLIIKSQPRIRQEDLRQVSSLTADLASFLFTAFVANVEEERIDGQVRYRLGAIAVGIGTPINGRDTIISPATQQKLGANVGLLAGQVLAKLYDGQQNVRLAGFTRTMALVDTPVVMVRGNRHRAVMIRYALLVDANTGRLDTLAWLLDRDDRGGFVGPSSPIEWLPPGKINDAVLRVDPNEFTLGIPSDSAFGLLRIPEGQKQIAFPDELKAVAAEVSPSAAWAGWLEGKLRGLLQQAGAAP
jgi:hypothetical protein